VAELAPAELQYVAAVAFDDAVYTQYSHKATTQTERDTRTRMEQSSTHVWRARASVLAEQLNPQILVTKKQKGKHLAALKAAGEAAAEASDSDSDEEGEDGEGRVKAARAEAAVVMPRRVMKADKGAVAMEEEGGVRKEKKKKGGLPFGGKLGGKETAAKDATGAPAVYKKRMRGPKPRGEERMAMLKAARAS
jgi:hypothetical protein